MKKQILSSMLGLLLASFSFAYDGTVHPRITDSALVFLANNKTYANTFYTNELKQIIHNGSSEPDHVGMDLTNDEIKNYSSCSYYNFEASINKDIDAAVKILFQDLSPFVSINPSMQLSSGIFGYALYKDLVAARLKSTISRTQSANLAELRKATQHTYVQGEGMFGESFNDISISPYCAQAEYNLAIKAWKVDKNYNEAMRRLGRVLHYVQDITVPHHISLDANIPDVVRGVVEYVKTGSVNDANTSQMRYENTQANTYMTDFRQANLQSSISQIKYNNDKSRSLPEVLISIRTQIQQSGYIGQVDGYSNSGLAKSTVSISSWAKSLWNQVKAAVAVAKASVTYATITFTPDVLLQLNYLKDVMLGMDRQIAGNQLQQIAEEHLNSAYKYKDINDDMAGAAAKLIPIAIVESAKILDKFAFDIGKDPASVASKPAPYIHYAFNNNLNDNSGLGHTATAVGGGAYVADRSQGYSAYQFNGIDQYVKYGPMNNFFSTSDPTAGSVSMTGWFSSTASTSGTSMLFFGFGKTAAQSNFQVGIGPNNTSGPVTVFRVNGWGDSYDWRTGVDPAPYFNGKWHQVAVTFDKPSRTTRFYIDGQQKAVTTSYSYTIDPNNSTTVIGCEIDLSGWNYNGAIDDFKIFSVALTGNDINAAYNMEKPFSKELQAFYMFNWDATDYSTHGVSGVMNCLLTMDRFGTPNSAASFNGTTNDVRSLGPLVSFPSGNSEKTICGWFKSSDRSAKDKMLFGFGKPAVRYNFQVGISSVGGSNIRFRVNAWAADWITTVDAYPYMDNAWHHCAVTYTGGTTSLYLDAVLKAQTTSCNFYTDPTFAQLVIGKEIDFAGWEWLGALDDVRVYSKALYAVEVTNLYNYEKVTP